MTPHEQTHLLLRVVVWWFLAGVAALGVWDLILIARRQLAGNSASEVILEVGRQVPGWFAVVALLVGFLLGHLLWPQVR